MLLRHGDIAILIVDMKGTNVYNSVIRKSSANKLDVYLDKGIYIINEHFMKKIVIN